MIAGSAYYYTTKRDDDGRHRTYYLGRDQDAARKKEQELSGKTSGLSSRSYKGLYLLVIVLCGLGLYFLSGQITGLFSFTPSSVIEFDLDESWNLSDALVRVSAGEYTEDFAVLDLVVGDKIVLDASLLNINSTGRAYADLIVGNALVDSRYVDIAEEETTGEAAEPDLELLKEETGQRLDSEDNVKVVSIEKQEDEYKVMVDIGSARKGSVMLQVGNVSDVKRVQFVNLPERVIQL